MKFSVHQRVYVKKFGANGTVMGIRIGKAYPYKVSIDGAGVGYFSDNGLKNISNKKENTNMTIRQKIRELARSKDEKNAIKTGFLSDQGNLTDVGRRTLLDYIWEGDEDLRARVFADINAVVEDECKTRKK